MVIPPTAALWDVPKAPSARDDFTPAQATWKIQIMYETAVTNFCKVKTEQYPSATGQTAGEMAISFTKELVASRFVQDHASKHCLKPLPAQGGVFKPLGRGHSH